MPIYEVLKECLPICKSGFVTLPVTYLGGGGLRLVLTIPKEAWQKSSIGNCCQGAIFKWEDRMYRVGGRNFVKGNNSLVLFLELPPEVIREKEEEKKAEEEDKKKKAEEAKKKAEEKKKKKEMKLKRILKKKEKELGITSYLSLD